MKKIQSIFLLVAAVILGSCDADKDFSEQDLTSAELSAKKSEGGIVFENKSGLTPLVNIFPEFNSVETYSLISTTDVLGDFQMGGAAGLGFELEHQTLPFNNLNLTEQEQQALVSFMKTLTDVNVEIEY